VDVFLVRFWKISQKDGEKEEKKTAVATVPAIPVSIWKR
jgi:hypothetical protein